MLSRLRSAFSIAIAVLSLSLLASPAAAFCGFYVAKANSDLFNEASKVVMVREGERTVITMLNDYQGDPSEFAMVIPTPTVLEEGQIHIGNASVVDHLDDYTAPRLVEYYDHDPCMQMMMLEAQLQRSQAAPASAMVQKAVDLGVTIEAEYQIGEYDILILSAKQSSGLQQWLDQEGYNVPPKARSILGSYIKQGMKFFVAKVNLDEKGRLGTDFLRPIQIAYEHDRFMLPIRLGTVNARGKQDLILYTLTKKGRVEATNYRTVKIPSNMDLPLFLKDKEKFGSFYKAMFETAAARENYRAMMLEYAWDMAWCDPCAADPLSVNELKQLGVFWFNKPGVNRQNQRVMPLPGGARNVYVTRLHVRYDAQTFPEDLMLQETGNRENFQGRYVMRHPFKGDYEACPESREYAANLGERFKKEAQRLAKLTRWDMTDIQSQMTADGQVAPILGPPKADNGKWWESLWE